MKETVAACRHPAWEFPNPLPQAGAECDDCGARYIEPQGTVNGVLWRDLDPEVREVIRALAQLRALEEFQYADEQEREGKRAVGNAKARVVRMMGWDLQHGDDCADRN